MSVTISNPAATFFLLVLLILTPGTSYSRNDESSRSLKLVLGGGIGHYFNTFTNVPDQDVLNNRPAISGRLMWQPEYRLRLGVESGLYSVYSTTRIQTDSGSEKLSTNLKVVPIFISISMKVINHLELNFGTGWADMIYTINPSRSKKDKIVGHTYSMSNYTGGFTYSYPLGKKTDVGAEFRYLYLGKTDDHHVSFLLNVSYRILSRKIR